MIDFHSIKCVKEENETTFFTIFQELILFVTIFQRIESVSIFQDETPAAN